ncbi:MAG: OsmC family protein [Phycisphaerales bacterium]|nr:OsmC family protein [Phycisphaerales bacterium]
MSVKSAHAVWNGSLKEGNGKLTTPSGLALDYTWKDRAEGAPGTSPEELIAAAHAGCFSMALSLLLGLSGHKPTRISTSADVRFEQVGGGFSITKISLKTEGQVPGITEAVFREHAEKAKVGCPVSKALANVPIDLQVKFIG